MDKLEFPCEFKMLGESSGPGSFEGLAAVFNNLDRQNDIIVPGAFASSLDEFVRTGFLASAHDWTTPIGTISAAIETPQGLQVAGEFHSTADAQNARRKIQERLERGKSIGMSIGFAIRDQEISDDLQVRKLTDIELFEVSVVTVPANPLAHMTGVKQIEPDHAKEARRTELRRILLKHLASKRVL